ncbi:caspase family protein [Devosia yakushimensis]|uniref:caspase family protein n=1 Tax=Devosia yakushimensis TaxID=470028 RepID=UPI0024E169D5|nr:caspase family protein [Devosia yakushimensis]
MLSIGCDKYEHVTQLNSAESDARAIFENLCVSDRYAYLPEKSILKLSPTLSQLNAALLELYEAKPDDVVVYFAGHSESRDGRLYLKVSDTQDTALPITSLTFADLVEKIAHIPSLQRLNVVLDSCNSSGLTTDLANVLSDRLRSNLGNISISILAGAAPHLAAKSTRSGGHLTAEVLKILGGTITAQRWSPFLELSQIAETVKSAPSVQRQEPSYWGMNIRGPNPFARNPNYDPALGATALPETFFGSDVKLSPDQVAVIRRFVAQVSTDGYSPDLLRPVQSSLEPLTTAQQISVFLGLAETLWPRDDETIGPPDGVMLLIQALIPLCSDKSAETILSFHAQRLISEIKTRILSISKKVKDDPITLARDFGGAMSGFYFFPIEISIILGWIGILLLHDDKISAEDIGDVISLIEIITEKYGNNLVCMEDRQAPGILMFCLAARMRGWKEQADAVISLYFNDLWSSGGRVARDELEADERLKFVLNKPNPLANLDGILQNPSELLGIILFAGAISGLDDEWDGLLIQIDHANLNFFICDGFTNFSANRIETGKNITLRVGGEFWSLFDLRQFIHEQIDKWTGTNDTLSLSMNALSVYFGDRTNWSYVFGLLHDRKIIMESAWRRLTTTDVESEERIILFEKGER